MGNFEGTRWRPYLDQEAQERRDEILNHLKSNYEGPSDFIKQKLMEEDALSLEEKIERAENEIERRKEDLEKFKQIKREREQQDKLRDKKELLKEKQNKLEKIQRKGRLSEEDALANAAIRVWRNCKSKADKPRNSDKTVVELFSKDRYQRRVSHYRDKQLQDSEEVDELVEDVQRLQRQVEELNGGREDWFLDLQSVEVSA